MVQPTVSRSLSDLTITREVVDIYKTTPIIGETVSVTYVDPVLRPIIKPVIEDVETTVETTSPSKPVISRSVNISERTPNRSALAPEKIQQNGIGSIIGDETQLLIATTVSVIGILILIFKK